MIENCAIDLKTMGQALAAIAFLEAEAKLAANRCAGKSDHAAADFWHEKENGFREVGRRLICMRLEITRGSR